MKIKLSKTDWKTIGQKMGWLKTAQMLSDGSPPWENEPERKESSDTVGVDMEDMELEEYPGVIFAGKYEIDYWVNYPHDEGEWNSEDISIRNIRVTNVHCSWLADGTLCPQNLEEVKEKIGELLKDPRHGWDHEEHIREHAMGNDPRPTPSDPDDARKNLGME
jgi:hypothetical protein